MKGRIKWVLPVCILALFTGCGAENKVEESVERMGRADTGLEESHDFLLSGNRACHSINSDFVIICHVLRKMEKGTNWIAWRQL